MVFILLGFMHGLRFTITGQFVLISVALGVLYSGDRAEFHSNLSYRKQNPQTRLSEEPSKGSTDSGDLRKIPIRPVRKTDKADKADKTKKAEKPNTGPVTYQKSSREPSQASKRAGRTQPRPLQKKALPKKGTPPKNNTFGGVPPSRLQTKPTPNSIRPNTWYFAWQWNVQSPLPGISNQQGGDSALEDYFREIDDVSAHFELESPNPDRPGSVQIRGHLPLHLLWQVQDTDYFSGYPDELSGLVPDCQPALQQALHTMYRSGLYLRWAIPFVPVPPAVKMADADPNTAIPTTGKAPRSSYLQAGSIRIRSDSLWYTLDNASYFPSSKTAMTGFPGRSKANTMSTMYERDKGWGQNFGLSWDGRNFHALLLHRRSSGEENLSTGLAVRLDQTSSPKSIGQNTGQNLYRLRAATLFSQNISKTDAKQEETGDWYFTHTGQFQNAKLYRAEAMERLTQLLRYDQAVKQFYLQAGWKHYFQTRLPATGTAKGEEPAKHKLPLYTSPFHKPYFQLGTEQAASVSPLDYWGNLQKYHIRFRLPLYAKQARDLGKLRLSKNVTLEDDFLASYYDANWVDARRKLAGSVLSQLYGRRLYLQNRLSLYFRQKETLPRQAGAVSQNGQPTPTRLRAKLREQTLHFDSGLRTIRLLQDGQTEYLNFGLQYQSLLHRKTAMPYNSVGGADSSWYLTIRANLTQQQPQTEDINIRLTELPEALWQRKLEWGIGWQQRPPTRIPQNRLSTPSSSSSTSGTPSPDKEPTRMAKDPNPGYRFPNPTTSPTRQAVHRFGWKAAIEIQEAGISNGDLFRPVQMYQQDIGKIENLQGSLKLSLFFQTWHYGRYQRGNTPRKSGWWKFFQLQLNLNLKLNFLQDVGAPENPASFHNIGAKLTFQAKFRASLQLSRQWSFLLALELDEWSLKQDGTDPQTIETSHPLDTRLSIRLQLRHEFSGRKQRNENNTNRTNRGAGKSHLPTDISPTDTSPWSSETSETSGNEEDKEREENSAKLFEKQFTQEEYRTTDSDYFGHF
ncbi:hypothetical protein P0082_03065 [Candidatus Haliotispira prima]|uniref:Cell surface protein SprA n=1 Tax=Candidatus Haliotispira prima TaxID=3034016 RepID=A0ABY8MKG0_9SPIO|nr:hypothetical protein P0082_03065 [Candidatus Haliotispira prima]